MDKTVENILPLSTIKQYIYCWTNCHNNFVKNKTYDAVFKDRRDFCTQLQTEDAIFLQNTRWS